jgi:hypothetical protein
MGSTLWKSETWQGNVTEGMTVLAFIVLLLRAIISCAVGISVNASGRMPSTKINIVLIK